MWAVSAGKHWIGKSLFYCLYLSSGLSIFLLDSDVLLDRSVNCADFFNTSWEEIIVVIHNGQGASHTSSILGI